MTFVFTDQQIEQLLRPIHPSRVLKDPNGMQYVEQHDVRAHLNRIFGFGNWDQTLTSLALAFEEPSFDRASGKPSANRWDCCYSASVRLTVRGVVRGAAGGLVNTASYEDAATGLAQNHPRGSARDLAVKAAVSGALKRAATSLGDQFGLSLYGGSTGAIVRGVIGWEKPSGEAPANVTPLFPQEQE